MNATPVAASQAGDARGDERGERQGGEQDEAEHGPHEAHDGELQRATIDLGVLHGIPFGFQQQKLRYSTKRRPLLPGGRNECHPLVK